MITVADLFIIPYFDTLSSILDPSFNPFVGLRLYLAIASNGEVPA